MYRTYTDNQIDAVSTNPYRQCIGEVETRLTRRQGKWEKVVGRGAIAWWGLPVGLMALFQADSKTSRYWFKRVNLSIFFWRREDLCQKIDVSCRWKVGGQWLFQRCISEGMKTWHFLRPENVKTELGMLRWDPVKRWQLSHVMLVGGFSSI